MIEKEVIAFALEAEDVVGFEHPINSATANRGTMPSNFLITTKPPNLVFNIVTYNNVSVLRSTSNIAAILLVFALLLPEGHLHHI
jgi:hypothetical protein